MAGKAPVGHMIILNNDNGMPMASIDLEGVGLDRQVEFGPPVIDLEYEMDCRRVLREIVI
jgi:hypothetical protein